MPALTLPDICPIGANNHFDGKRFMSQHTKGEIMFAFSLRKFFWGVLVAGVGVLVWAGNYGLVHVSFNFSKDWPAIIVLIGLMSVWKAVFGRHWWSKCCGDGDRIPSKAKKILEDLEKGEISAEEAAKKMDY